MSSTKSIPSIKSVMTPFPHAVESEASILTARAMMERLKIRHLPVTEKGELVGIISDRDISVALSLGQHIEDESLILVGDACTVEPYTVDVDAKLDEVVLTMARKHIGSALVLQNGSLTGIFTTTDACKFLGEFLQSFYEAPYKD